MWNKVLKRILGLRKDNYIPILLVILVSFFLINNSIWLARDTLPPSWDQSAHANFCLKYYRLFSSPMRLSITKLLNVTHYWPPFFYISSVPVLFLLGYSFDAIALTNFLYLILLVFSIYKIGTFFFNKTTGLGAVFLTLFFPMVFALSRDILLDFSLLALIALTQYIILISKAGMSRKWSFMLGIAMAFSLLTKWTAATFFIGSLSFIFFKTWRTEKQLRRQAAISLAIAVLIFLIIVLPWYISAFKDFMIGAKIAVVSDPSREGDPSGFNLRSMLWYWDALRDVLISKVILLFCLLGLVAYIIWVKKWNSLVFLLSWIVPAFFIFVALPNKDGRFIVPFLPAIGILTSAGICSLPWKWAKVSIWTLLILLGIFQFYAISFGWPISIDHYYTHPPLRQDWKIEEILKTLEESYPSDSLSIGILPNQPYFNPNIFRLYQELLKLPYMVEGLGDRPVTREQLKKHHVFISKSGPLSVEHTALHRINFFNFLAKEGIEKYGFRLWKKFPLPDGSEAKVFLQKL